MLMLGVLLFMGGLWSVSTVDTKEDRAVFIGVMVVGVLLMLRA